MDFNFLSSKNKIHSFVLVFPCTEFRKIRSCFKMAV